MPYSSIQNGEDWNPHLPKAQPLEVLHVHRCEFGHALRDHRERRAGVVKFSEGEGGGAGFLPEGIVQRAALGGEADESPARVRAVSLDDFHGFGGGERVLEHGRVAEEAVELGKDEFGDGYVFVARNRHSLLPPKQGSK